MRAVIYGLPDWRGIASRADLLASNGGPCYCAKGAQRWGWCANVDLARQHGAAKRCCVMGVFVGVLDVRAASWLVPAASVVASLAALLRSLKPVGAATQA